MSAVDTAFFVAGGTLGPDSKSYVERSADRELYEGLLAGEYCYVLTSRQMGKSSLMARTARRLREQHIRVVVLDLTAVGRNLTPEQWYDGLVVSMGRQLRLEDELDKFWLDHTRLSPVQRFTSAIREMVLENRQEPLVIFIDEIDAVRSLPFSTDEFFAAIRECYNRRSEEAQFRQLTFCLLGVAIPSDLIRDVRTTPFNVGKLIELTDFKADEAAPLAHGLNAEEPLASELLSRILYWTNGHPYLTQRLCRATAESNVDPNRIGLQIENSRSIDRLCESLFLSSRARERDDNLLFVRERLLRSEVELGSLLTLYDRIRNFQPVPDDESNSHITVFRLSGITRMVDKLLRVRNRIYERVFDHDWVMANMPVLRQTGITAIAVLPFTDERTDPRHEYWADGLTEELIDALGQVPGLRVASCSSAFEFKGKSENLREVASKLRVEVVLEGAVQRAEDRVRILVELVSVPDGYRLWSEPFNFRTRDVVEIKNELATAVVARLKSGLRTRPGVGGSKPPTENQEAYNLYLKARYHWNKRNEDAVRRSAALFQEAVHLDPKFALAHAGLADAYSILGTYSYIPPLEAYPKARNAAMQALELDEQLAQAHATLGCVYCIYDWDWARAETEFTRAVELNPSYAAAYQWHAVNCLTPLGRHDESLAALRTAQAIDPLSLSVQASLALAFYHARAYDESIRQCRLTLEMEEGFWLAHLFLAWACLQSQQIPQALAAAERACDLAKNDPVALATFGLIQARAGQRAAATERLEKLTQMADQRYVSAADIAALCLELGDPDQSLRWLERAQVEKSLPLIYVRVEPRLDGLREDPRFLRILQKMRLEDSAKH